MIHITYILGAGASVKAHPSVKEFSEELKKSATSIQKYMRDKPSLSLGIKESYNEIISNFNWLSEEIASHTSPDTKAKVAYLRKDLTLYKKIKDTLSAFFFMREVSIEFRYATTNDPRYINFISSLLKKEAVFPENVKIISWNYDFQFQIAANLIKEDLDESPLIEYSPNQSKAVEFSFINLNGCSYVNSKTNYYHAKGISLYHFWDALKQANINEFIRFAWEGEERLNVIKSHLQKTQILVIIGYSFPSFNREIDKEIFKTFTPGVFKKIYFQNPTLQGDFLKEQFELQMFDSNFPIKHIESGDYFHIPYEF